MKEAAALYQNPELVQLFETYTGAPGSIGARLAELTAAATAKDPLIVATSTDIVLFPGGGAEPQVQGFRLATRGFKELAAISHHGPAVASLLKMRELSPQSGPGSELWREQALRLVRSTQSARAANSAALWRERIAVPAFRGREEAIARLVDYSCGLTLRYLERVLAEPRLFTAEDLRRHYLEADGDAAGASVPMNAVMIATFFLVGMDTANRVIAWFDEQRIDWSRAMALIVGQQGRPTAGVTWSSNSVAAMILGSARGRLALERLYIAPHGPSFRVAELPDMAALRAFETPLRQLWTRTRTVSELGPLMYADYPFFDPGSAGQRPVVDAHTRSVSEMPAIADPADWRALNTRLRVVLEDPRQLLSGCVTDYAVDQLIAHGNDPARVTVPGLDGTDYPAPG